MKTTIQKILPAGYSWRELWLPEQITNNATLPSALSSGHSLTLTGARKATTADGLYCPVSANTGISLGAIHNGQAKIAVSMRIRPKSNVAPSGSWRMLFRKIDTASDVIYVSFDLATGSLRFYQVQGGAVKFNLYTVQTSWNAGTWYHVYFASGQSAAGGAASDGARLRIDNGTAVTSSGSGTLPPGGVLYLGTDESNNAANCDISDVYIMTDDVTANEEADLYKGIPPADAVHVYTLDEGMGLVANDRGSGAVNGTIGSACTWTYGSCKQPVLSPDGANDYASSSALCDIGGIVTVVYACKAKSISTTSVARRQFRLRIDGNNQITLGAGTSDSRKWAVTVGGSGVDIATVAASAIDNYEIHVVSISNGTAAAYYNGSLVSSNSFSGNLATGGASAWFGASPTPDGFEPSKVLFSGNISGALSASQAKELSRKLNKMLGLGLVI